MDLENNKELDKRILEFLKENEEKDITGEMVRNNFSINEIVYIILKNENSETLKSKFNNLILFNQEESDKLISEIDVNNIKVELLPVLLKQISLDSLFNLLDKIIENSENIDIGYYLSSIISLVDNKEYQEQAINKMINSKLDLHTKRYLLFDILEILKDDKLTIKYLSKIYKHRRSDLISTIQDDKIKETFLTITRQNKGVIISSLSSDQKKLFYLKKYSLFLNSDEKVNIILSLENIESIKQNIGIFNTDHAKQYLVRRLSYRNQSLAFEVAKTITSPITIGEIIHYFYGEEELYFNLLCKLDEKTKIKIIKKNVVEGYDFNFNFSCLKYIDDFSICESIVEHIENFPKYEDKFEFLIDKYASNYNLNKDHLLCIVRNLDFSVLRIIKNKNIQNIINLDEESFNKIMQIFSKDNILFEAQSMNNILNSILQRKFKIEHSDIINTYSNIKAALQRKDNNKAIELFNNIEQVVDIKKYLDRYSFSKEQFLELLFIQDPKAINCLHEMATSYVIYNRNKFTQDNILELTKKCTLQNLDRESLMNVTIQNYPIYIIIDYLKEIYNLSEEEKALVNNEDLLTRLIKYKRDPKSYQPIPEDIKINLKLFNQLFKKIYINNYDYYLSIRDDIKYNNIIEEVNNENLITVLANLDVDRLTQGIFDQPEMFQNLLKVLKQYKMLGWGNSIITNLTDVDLLCNSDIISNFIQYFHVMYGSLKEKVDRNELATISMTSLIDLANTYSSESKKYSMIFGKVDFALISGNPGPNSSHLTKSECIEKAIELLPVIRKRSYVTIPPVDKNYELKSNKKINIVVGNFSNIMNLTYGERTGACMRIGGAGESLFNYCLKDENGFHIRFTNPDTGKFVSRVSGFRNGNTVFLNELRFPVDSNYTNEDIEEACKIISEELICLSKSSNMPIENVVISDDLVMKGNKTIYLGVSNIKKGVGNFYTDVTENAVVLATSNPDNSLMPVKLGNVKVPKYPVQRDKKKYYTQENCQTIIIQLESLDQVLSGKNIDEVEVNVSDDIIMCYAGEDWYVSIDRFGNIKEFIMKNCRDKKLALEEIQQVLPYIKSNNANLEQDYINMSEQVMK